MKFPRLTDNRTSCNSDCFPVRLDSCGAGQCSVQIILSMFYAFHSHLWTVKYLHEAEAGGCHCASYKIPMHVVDCRTYITCNLETTAFIQQFSAHCARRFVGTKILRFAHHLINEPTNGKDGSLTMKDYKWFSEKKSRLGRPHSELLPPNTCSTSNCELEKSFPSSHLPVNHSNGCFA